MNVIVLGTLASLAAGAMTAVGAIPVAFGKSVSVRAQDTLLGFAAGVMLAASFFSLIIPAIEAARRLYGGAFVPAGIAAGGVIIGVVAIALANEWIPHRHFVQGLQGPAGSSGRKVWLFVAAITIHNFPEGGAVGVGYAGNDLANATALAVGIGLQNAPEGLAVAVALRAEGYSRGQAFLVAALTALVEPIGGFIGVTAVTLARPLMPWALTFAAGAMIYVISHEIIPETHTRGHQREATAGLSVGLVLMMFLDVALG
ncbi:MAG: ZIP family metal transporter [Bauldia sp.]